MLNTIDVNDEYGERIPILRTRDIPDDMMLDYATEELSENDIVCNWDIGAGMDVSGIDAYLVQRGFLKSPQKCMKGFVF